jgi:hypothetical protein
MLSDGEQLTIRTNARSLFSQPAYVRLLLAKYQIQQSCATPYIDGQNLADAIDGELTFE